MKNGLKKIIGSFLIILILISNFILCFGVEFDINAQEQGKEYKKRKFTVNGVEDTILTYNDEIFFSGENKNVTDNQKKLNNYIALGISIFLIVYWVILLFIFEKEETCDFTFD